MVHTNPHQPSVSLIKQICYPEAHRFTTKATEYGCEHEAVSTKKRHGRNTNHNRWKSILILLFPHVGFFLDRVKQYIGASPDGLVTCSCCGEGVLEIKCPHCARDADSLLEVATKRGKKFCLEETEAGLRLSQNHQYYFQCQLQMHVTGRKYCVICRILTFVLYILYI